MGQGGGCCGPEDPGAESQTQVVHGGRSEAGDRYPHAGSPGGAPVAASQPRAGAAPAAAPAGVTFDAVLVDLDGAETTVWRDAFATIAERESVLPHSNDLLREFLASNSAVTLDDMDGYLFMEAPEGSLGPDAFVQFLRNHAISESDAIQHFTSMGNGEDLASEDCRNLLLIFAQAKIPATLTDDKWDRILNTVMIDADLTVPIEKQIQYAKVLSRIVRVVHYAQLN